MAGLQGTARHESGMFVWGLALEVEPLDDPGTHYPQAIQLLINCNNIKNNSQIATIFNV
jgi:hypothetical protein